LGLLGSIGLIPAYKPFALFGATFGDDLAARLHPNSLTEMFLGDAPPFDEPKCLPPARADRIALLRRWLSQLPAQKWLEQQQPIAQAHQSFRRIQGRRTSAQGYREDLAEFAFWWVAHQAWLFRRGKRRPPPNAEDRQRAADAARTLLRLYDETDLLPAEIVPWESRDRVVDALRCIQAHSGLARRKRQDSNTSVRDFVELLSEFLWRAFGDVSPAIVCELVQLHGAAPDQTEMTKRIASWKKGRRAPERMGI